MAMQNFNSDPIRDSLNGAVGLMVSAFQPQIETYVNQFADQAIGRVENAAVRSVQTLENKPWLLVGIAAAMLVSAGLMIRANRPMI